MTCIRNEQKPVLRIRDVYPGSRSKFFRSRPDPRSRVKKIPDPGSASKNWSILNPKKNCSKLSEIWTGMFSLDPDLDILPIPVPGVKKAPDPGSPQHWKKNSYPVPYRLLYPAFVCKYPAAFVCKCVSSNLYSEIGMVPGYRYTADDALPAPCGLLSYLSTYFLILRSPV